MFAALASQVATAFGSCACEERSFFEAETIWVDTLGGPAEKDDDEDDDDLSEVSTRPSISDVQSEPDASTPTSAASTTNTVVIFDWDDTLLCSTAVRGRSVKKQQLRELEGAVDAILRQAMQFGEAVIITNGSANWVEESCSRFLPGLLPLVKQLTVVSARALYATMYPGDPVKWKHAAFEQILTKERGFSQETGLNLVALGDDQPEMAAARNIGQVLGGSSLVKTVKFHEAPSVGELIGQLGQAKQALGQVVQETANREYGLVMNSSLGLFNTAASASSWRCASQA